MVLPAGSANARVYRNYGNQQQREAGGGEEGNEEDWSLSLKIQNVTRNAHLLLLYFRQHGRPPAHCFCSSDSLARLAEPMHETRNRSNCHALLLSGASVL